MTGLNRYVLFIMKSSPLALCRLSLPRWLGAKRHLRDFRYSCRAEKRKFLGIVSEVFEFTTELFSQEAFPDAGQSTELASVKDVLATSKIAAKEANGQLTSLRGKHRTLESSLLAGFNKAQGAWNQQEEALHH